jgi:hypothetical protein
MQTIVVAVMTFMESSSACISMGPSGDASVTALMLAAE